MSEYIVRKAKDGDYEEIIRLSNELAVCSKLPNAVSITPEMLRKHRQLFECLVVEPLPNPGLKKTVIVGFALFTYSYDAWVGKVTILQDLYISQEHRGLGLGTKLMQHVAKTVVDNGHTELIWMSFNWNTSGINFYNRIGGVDRTKEGGVHYFKMYAENLHKLASKL